MRISIVTVGKLRLSFAQDGFAEYMKRLSVFHQVDVIHVKDGKKSSQKISDVTCGSFVVLLDEIGALRTSREMAVHLRALERDRFHVSFVFGGPDGHTAEVRALGDEAWSLSPLTLPHDLSVVFLSEALYRAATINVSHPYHRD